jgi:hypothetical protein
VGLFGRREAGVSLLAILIPFLLSRLYRRFSKIGGSGVRGQVLGTRGWGEGFGGKAAGVRKSIG